ncbi:hypothetical protein Ancab_015098 [Ancistrocladus abbreviatus]
MDGSMGMGCMAVFAVSGSVALLAFQAHKRLLSDFMKRIEFEFIGSEKHQQKKKVRFIEDGPRSSIVSEESQEMCLRKPRMRQRHGPNLEDTMPLNRVALYKGILKYRMTQSSKRT